MRVWKGGMRSKEVIVKGYLLSLDAKQGLQARCNGSVTD